MEKQPITTKDIILIFIIISLGITLIVMTYHELKILSEKTIRTQIIADPISPDDYYLDKNDYEKINQVEQEEIVESICTDSDGGINYGMKGMTSDGMTDSCSVCDSDKFCTNVNYPAPNLTEYYCYGTVSKVTSYECPNGCKDGTCIIME